MKVIFNQRPQNKNNAPCVLLSLMPTRPFVNSCCLVGVCFLSFVDSSSSSSISRSHFLPKSKNFLETLCPHFEKYRRTCVLMVDFRINMVKYGLGGRSEIQFADNNSNCIQRRYSRFFTISSQRRKLSPTHTLKRPGRNRVQITRNTSSVYHVQVSC